ncbi:MAG: sterol desaturase family protein [Actinomycetota bacterium]|nr:sterol desaturase family protein [Actinomycetota bacterium]
MRSATLETRSLRGAAATFWGFPTPWVLGTLLAAAVAARLAVGSWRWWHLLVAGGVVAAQPFVEWLLHVTVLHARPVRVAGRVLDLYVSRKHREHHADPRNLAGSFIPPRVLGYLLVLIAGICAAIPGWPTRLTAAATMLTLGLLYEWTHFLIHSDYKPRHAPYRALYIAHRLHHYRNEHYWYGVTGRLGDKVLGTNPARDDVPVSPTCRTLLEPVGASRS